ncbi:MAG: methyltransferase domain-containing protein [Glaciecola sp.]|jgi:23S rRNA (guanine745-N1)-methyltransferase|nr:methyltransferase domain-containing protein [Glaciecola sp.]MDG1814979.1 methyltransferase domain-containing protein [Glaciecola sp.]MDG2100665.1 methyltransferase domain-containing protein [Glaciecola sp.]
MWQCPLCASPLSVQTNQPWRCDNGHSFDVAKQGYVNLLPVQFKNSLQPGDDKVMVQAREAFLNAGFYAPLIQAISADIQSHRAAGSVRAIYDAGCGEGYYLRQLSALLDDPNITYQGNDIAKNAVLRAAKQAQQHALIQHQYVVASSYHLPLKSNQIDVLLQVFAPMDTAEAVRVLNTGGLWYQVVPNQSHLQEFKTHLYDTVTPHAPEPLTDVPLLKEIDVAFVLDLTSVQKSQLFAMTPYAHSANANKRALCIDDPSSVTIDFKIYVYQLPSEQE